MRNNKVLITGATGYVGRRVVAILLAMGRPVRVLVHAHTTEEILPSGIEKIEGDIFDVVSLNRACDGVGSVIHLAAVVREKGPNTFMSVNLEGTINLLESASNMGVERFIFASTIGATSDTAIPYLNSRWMAEQEIINKGMLYTIVRFSVGFGKGDEFFTILASQAKLFPLIPLAGTGANRFQPIAVDDVAKCLVVALNRDEFIGETVEAGGIKCYTYDQLVDLVARTLDVRISKLHIPLQVIKPIAWMMQRLMPRPPVTTEQIKMIAVDNVANGESVEKKFGFNPRPLEGNLDYLLEIRLRDALRMNLGLMPTRVRDY